MKTILITGGDGYLGRRLARIFLSHPDSTVLLWVRAANQEQFKSKGKRLCQELCEPDGRLRLFYGDLRDEEPFNTIDPQNINLIVHTAAVTRFNVDHETAQAINVNGTRKLLNFAQSCSGLDQLMFVSTIYASGLQEGEI